MFLKLKKKKSFIFYCPKYVTFFHFLIYLKSIPNYPEGCGEMFKK